MPEKDVVADRRAQGDRREGSVDEGRRGGKQPTSGLVYVFRSLALIALLLVVIVYTVVNTRPIYSTSGTLGDELRKHAPGVAATNGAPASQARLRRSPAAWRSPRLAAGRDVITAPR